MLFNVMINDIFVMIPSGRSYSLFADICAIWCSDKDSEHSIPRLQRALYHLDNWSSKNGCIFSPTKSAVMLLFTKNTRMYNVSDLSVSNRFIPRVTSFKFLGVVLDPRLSMAKHVQHIKAKCARRLNLFRCTLLGLIWGLTGKLYFGCIKHWYCLLLNMDRQSTLEVMKMY